MDGLEKYKFDSIVAQLKIDFTDREDQERVKYIDFMETTLKSYVPENCEEMGLIKLQRFIDRFGERLFAWKLGDRNE